MLKKIVVGVLVLSILGCIAGVVVKDAFVYVLSLMMLVAAILFGLLMLTVNFVWRLFPEDFKKTRRVTKRRFDTIIFSSALFFYITSGLIDEIYLRGMSGLIRWLGIVTIFVFAAFWGWGLIRRTKIKTMAIGSVIFVLLIVSVLLIGSTSLKSDKAAVDSSLAKLGSLPYLDWVPAEKDIEKKGVIQYDHKLTFDGLNLYSSATANEAYLIDMQGNVVHRWSEDIHGRDVEEQHVELCKNGDLLAIMKDRMLMRLDWDSKVKWKTNIRIHHDIYIDENKQMYYVLAREDAMVFWHKIPVPILSDFIAVLSWEGKAKRKIYLYDLIKEQIPLTKIVRLYTGIFRFKEIAKFFVHRVHRNYICQDSWHFDIIHTNSIEAMDRDIEGFCKKGDWLISIRDLDLIVILDPEKEEFVWSWGPGELSMQHDARLLENGNVLVFDNGCSRGFSRIIELEPLTKKIVWEYKSNPPETFYSALRGSSQRLPNGNTLITDGNKGRAFEVTSKGEVVWDFYNTNIRAKEKVREAIYRLTRITDLEDYKLKLRVRKIHQSTTDTVLEF